MRTINRVFLLGNLGADVELRYTEGGQAVGKLRLATSRARKLDDGTWEELTDWHNVVAFGTLAERCNTHLAKGSGVMVEGRLSERSFEDSSGARRKITEVIAREVVFLPRRQATPQPRPEPAPRGDDQQDADVPF